MLKRSGKKVTVNVFDYIDRWGFSVAAFANALDGAGQVDEITVKINSPGGSAFDGAAMYNTLVQHDAKVRVEVHGLAGSAASVIAMAGDEILMGTAARLFIHEPLIGIWGPARVLEKYAAELRSMTEDFIDLYAQQATNVKRAEIAQMLHDETELSAKQSIDMGFATGHLNEADKSATMQAAVNPESVKTCADLKQNLQGRFRTMFRDRDETRPVLSRAREKQDLLNARIDAICTR